MGQIMRRLGVAVLSASMLSFAVPGAHADVVQLAQNQARPTQVQIPSRLRPELLTIYDCRRELELVTFYWDRLAGQAGVRLDRRFVDAAVRAFQQGNVEECWRTIGDLRRHMGI